MPETFFRRHRFWFGAVAFLFVLVGVVFLYREKTIEIFAKRPNVGALLAGVFALTLECFVAAWRWKLLLHAGGVAATFQSVYGMTVCSRLAQVTVSAASAGDLARAGIVAAKFSNRLAGVGAIVLDRVVGLVGLLLCAVIGGLIHFAWYDEPLVQRLTFATMAMLLVSLVGLRLMSWSEARRWLLRCVPFTRLRMFVSRAAEGLAKFSGDRLLVSSCVLLAVGTHVLSIAAFYFAAVGLHVASEDVLLFFVIVPFVFLASAIPLPVGSVVASVGVGELLFRLMGIEGGALYTLAYRLLMVAATLLAAVVIPFMSIGFRSSIKQDGPGPIEHD